MTDSNLNTRVLQDDLGVDDEYLQEPVFPAPLDLDDSPPGKDSYGQDIIDGAKTDDFVEIPGLEDDFIAVLHDSIAPDDDDSLQAIAQDIAEHTAVLDDAQTISGRLSDLEDEIRERGAIQRADAVEAIKIFPGLNDYMPPLNSIPESLTLTGYEEGLNAMSAGQKALGGGILLGLLALIFKIASTIHRVSTSRENMSVIQRAKKDPSASALKPKYDLVVKMFTEKFNNSDNPTRVAELITKYMTDNFPNFKLTSNDIQKNPSVVIDVLFADKIKGHYKVVHDLMVGDFGHNSSSANGVTAADVPKTFTTLPKGIKAALDKLKENVDKAISDFSRNDTLDLKDYMIGDVEMTKMLGVMGDPTGTLGRLKVMATDVQNPKVKTVTKYIGNDTDVTDSLTMDQAAKSTIDYLLSKKQELQRLLDSIQDSKNPERIKNRAAILQEFTRELTLLQNFTTALYRVRLDVSRLISDLDDSIKSAATIIDKLKTK